MKEAIELFLAEKNITKESNRNRYNYYKNLEKHIQNYDLKTIDRNEFIDLMSDMNPKSIQSFYVLKSSALAFVRWAVDKRIMDKMQITALTSVSFDDVKKDAINRSYVGTLDELIELLEMQNEDTEKYDTIICGCYLCWCGIKPKDIVNVEKNDIKNGYILYNNKRYDIPDRRIKEFLLEYRDADSYISDNFGRETEIPYVKSIYLLRSYKNDHLTYNIMRTNISIASRKIYDKTLSFGKIYESGLFYRAYQYEQTIGTKEGNKSLVEFFKMNFTNKNASNKIKDYNNWKKIFHNHKNILDK